MPHEYKHVQASKALIFPITLAPPPFLSRGKVRMRQVPLERDYNIAMNGPFWVEVANPEHPFTSMLISRYNTITIQFGFEYIWVASCFLGCANISWLVIICP